jgi:hypothetical protein
MDHYSILDHAPSSPAMERTIAGAIASRAETASVSAGIAAANARLAKPSEPGPRFPGEDGGLSLAEMAHADLDAALQLLADRAQYITGASGAAIALRRGEHHDMLCRASVGSNAPELGALLSMEYGLSGESVRTRQVLRCDDAERDPRVNHDVCRELGIASVVVMPIVNEQQVLGVFELLSGKPRAFEERDISALLRLCEMVQIAIKHAGAAQVRPAAPEPTPRAAEPVPVPALTSQVADQEVPPPKQEAAAPAPKKALFWSAAMRAQNTGEVAQNRESVAVPPVLRNLHKCQACGFPVSQGRTFCVECEEKQWRGQPLLQLEVSLQTDQPLQTEPQCNSVAGEALGTFVQDFPSSEIPIQASEPASVELATTAPTAGVSQPQELTSRPVNSAIIEAPVAQPAIASADEVPSNLPSSENAALFLSSSMQSESWFAANKYILGALLVVAIVIGAIAWLR